MQGETVKLNCKALRNCVFHENVPYKNHRLFCQAALIDYFCNTTVAYFCKLGKGL